MLVAFAAIAAIAAIATFVAVIAVIAVATVVPTSASTVRSLSQRCAAEHQRGQQDQQLAAEPWSGEFGMRLRALGMNKRHNFP
jgi:hypothetical protein